MLVYENERETHHSLFLATTESKSFAANNSEIALRKLPEIFFKLTCFDGLVVQVLVKMRVSDYIIPDRLILTTISLRIPF